MNCIVIEDEPLALKKITEFIVQVEYLNLLKGFDNAISALGFLKDKSVDLVFLDIRMKKLSGIQFLESLSIKPIIIITSAYDEYALKGYELDVSDYLLKPFSFERFLRSVDRIHNKLVNKKPTQQPGYIFIKTEYRIEKVELNNILYIQGMKDYLQICTTNKKIMTLKSFKNLACFLPAKEFIRVHNSFMVSISKIESIERNRIKIGDKLIPVSESYKESFYKKIHTINTNNN